MKIHITVKEHLNDARDSYRRSTAQQRLCTEEHAPALSFSAPHLQICLSVSGSSEAFTCARWTLLQVCPHVLFKDIFNVQFRKLRKRRHHHESNFLDFVSDAFEDAKARLAKRGCLPRYMEFAGWAYRESVKTYVSRMRSCLLDDESKRAFDERFPEDALDMLLEKFVGRLRPANVATVCPCYASQDMI
ncbi:hypothetical protein BG015_008670 [Linnemannia schmuckeri]|uniref:Uncharacterized protein n=1 Tax=Linnemannia schmuckeri TaxID=64567 RepID=A0A9P5VAC9_9FUNG|nr:hypothetical protein BG015_008670 [Linnemannia schmuckeri]